MADIALSSFLKLASYPFPSFSHDTWDTPVKSFSNACFAAKGGCKWFSFFGWAFIFLCSWAFRLAVANKRARLNNTYVFMLMVLKLKNDQSVFFMTLFL